MQLQYMISYFCAVCGIVVLSVRLCVTLMRHVKIYEHIVKLDYNTLVDRP